jgi:hypothetical protein
MLVVSVARAAALRRPRASFIDDEVRPCCPPVSAKNLQAGSLPPAALPRFAHEPANLISSNPIGLLRSAYVRCEFGIFMMLGSLVTAPSSGESVSRGDAVFVGREHRLSARLCAAGLAGRNAPRSLTPQCSLPQLPGSVRWLYDPSWITMPSAPRLSERPWRCARSLR